jgi:VWFA-related protein
MRVPGDVPGEQPRAARKAVSTRALASGLSAVMLLQVVPAHGSSASAQTPEKPKDVPTFGVTTELVYVRFHVERKGAPVASVTKDQIRVLEDGKPQAIALLDTPSLEKRSLPPEVTLAIDVSGSVMDARLLDEELIRDVFIAGLSEETSVGLCAFGGELRCFAPPTRDVRALLNGFQEALFFAREMRHQGTRLYGSVAEICEEEEKTAAKTQRAVVVFSDGIDNRGGKVQQAIDAAAQADVRVYAVKLSQQYQATAPGRLGGGGFDGPRATYDYRKFDLDKLAGETGGRAYEPQTLSKKKLAEILADIAESIRMEYVVGYAPASVPSGKKRRIKVELVDKSIGSIPDGERTLVR